MVFHWLRNHRLNTPNPLTQAADRKHRSRARPLLEQLEDRVVPATLTWVGDQDANWNTNNAGDTNWSGDALPMDGDTLIFNGNAVGALNNDTTAGNSYTLQFNTTGGYTINGNSILLDNAGDDITDDIGGNAINAPMTLAADTAVDISAGTHTISGVLSGAGGLTKIGIGTLILSGANTYSGGTDIDAGTLNATVNTGQNSLGTGAVDIAGVATAQLNNTNTGGGTVTISNTFTGSGQLQLLFANGGSARNTIMDGITGFAGTVQLSLAGANTADKLRGQTNNPNADLIIDAGTQLFLNGNTTFNSITASGAGNTENRGAIRLSNTLNGPITLVGNTAIGAENGTINGSITSGAAGTQTLTIGTSSSTGNSTFNGPINDGTGTIALLKNNAGTATLSGNGGNNTYTGTTTVSAGILQLGTGFGGDGGIRGDITVNSGGIFRLLGDNKIINSSDVTINAGGTFDMNSRTDVVGNIQGGGNITNNNNGTGLVLDELTGQDFTGVISGTGGFQLRGLLNAGTQTLSGANTYTGTTTITGGDTLLVNGSITSNSTVQNGGTLGGTGTVTGTVTAQNGGTVSPGTSPGILGTGNTNLMAGSNFNVEVNGNTPGAQHDQLDVTGTVNVTGANLVTSGTITSSPNQTIVLINNDSNDAVTGTFVGVAEGSTVNINGVNFIFSYQGGDGNDVTLTEPGPVVFNGDGTAENFELRRVVSGPADLIQLLRNGTVVDSRPASTVSSYTVNGNGDNDTLTIDYTQSGGGFGFTVNFNGGPGTDALSIVGTPTGATVNTATYNFTGSGADGFNGDIDLDGTTINFTGLEPLANSGTAANIIFNLPNVVNPDATLQDSANAGETELVGSTFEDTIFTNPTTSLTINGGTMADTILVEGVDAAFNADLNINATSAGDSVTFQTNPTNIGAGDYDIDSRDIAVNANATTTGDAALTATTGSITDDADDNVANLTADEIHLTLSSGGNLIGANAGNRFELNANVLQVTANAGGGNSAFLRDTAGGVAMRNSTVNAGGNTFNMEVLGGNITSETVDGTRDLGAGILILTTDGGSLGTGLADRLEINATTRFDATTAGGDIFVLDPDANLPVGAINAGAGTVDLLVTQTNITDANGGATNITATAAALRSDDGIGSGNALETAISTLAATNATSGNIQIDNSVGGLLTIGTVNGLAGITNTGGGVTVTNASPVTVAANVTAVGAVTLTATDTAAAGDDFTINAGVTIQSTGSSVTLNAGDNFTDAATSSVIAATSITINGDTGGAIDAAGSTIDLNGTFTAGTLTTVLGNVNDDTINVNANNFTGSLTLDGGGGGGDILNFNVSLTLTSPAGADLIASAETINMNAAAITTSQPGGDQTYTGNVNLTTSVVLTGDDIDITGDVAMNAFNLTVDTTAGAGDPSTITGIISGGGNLNKNGTGRLDLTNAANTYTGNTNVNAGTLALVNAGSTNNIPASAIINVFGGAILDVTGLSASTLEIQPGQLLQGVGTINGNTRALTGSAEHPGFSPGILTNNGNVTFENNSNFNVELQGEVPGTEHSQLVVNGTITLNQGILNLSGNPANIELGDTFLIMLNDDAGDTVTGDFVSGTGIGLPAGTMLPEGTGLPNLLGSGIGGVITYQHNDGAEGNDVLIGTGVFLSNGTLFAIGTENRERFHMWQQGGTIFVTATWGFPNNNTPFTRQFQFPEAAVNEINVRMFGDVDTLTMQPEITKPTTVEGGDGNDYIRTGSGDTIIGALGTEDAGDDYIVTGGGNDTISDTMGNNRIQTFGGNDTVTTGPGNDIITTDEGNDIVDAGEGNNDVRIGNGNDTVTTGDGNDHITAQNGDNVITAGNGDNNITTNNNTSTDTITAGNGNDRIFAYGQSNSIINAGDGNNTVSDYGGAVNTITTGSGNDSITAGAGTDIINAGNGNNTIYDNGGNCVCTTGTGVDNINTGSGDDIINAGDGNDRISSGDGNDVIDGEGGNDTINSGGGDDLVRGGAGADMITDTGGNNVLIGNAGNDRFYTYGSGRQIIIGGTGADNVRAAGGDSILIGGTTNFDTNTAANNAALNAIRAEWVSAGSYAVRTNNIRTGGGLTAGNMLTANGTVQNDGADVDLLVGSSGQDWYFASVVDMVFGQRPDEDLDLLV